ncbi:MAG: hypothetical protein JNL02_08575 [Saprospiraceae bacterium]|nr:hypothetical protein [Saprospiraceae bacterium]
MHYLTERNERQSRQSAFVMAVLLHLGLIAALYLLTMQEPSSHNNPVPIKKTEQPAANDGRTAAR